MRWSQRSGSLPAPAGLRGSGDFVFDAKAGRRCRGGIFFLIAWTCCAGRPEEVPDMFVHASAIFQMLARTDNILLVLLCCGTVLLWTRQSTSGRRIMTAAAGLAAVVAVFPVGDWLAYPLEQPYAAMRVAPATVDGIV